MATMQDISVRNAAEKNLAQMEGKSWKLTFVDLLRFRYYRLRTRLCLVRPQASATISCSTTGFGTRLSAPFHVIPALIYLMGLWTVHQNA
jgi:hypothetical protein